ncbi:hypothetical protein [Citrobacter phage Tr1]|nr:hypothetical protein [Citrobacter phage Tr1]
MEKESVVTNTDNLYVITGNGQTMKGEGFLGRYKTIGYGRGVNILSRVEKANPLDKTVTTLTKAKRGFMTLGSVIGNGRFRDRGISEDLLLKLFSNDTFLKRVNIEYKVSEDEDFGGTLVYEAIVHTQSLQKELSKLKANVTTDANGVTGTLRYLGEVVPLNAAEMQRMKEYI